MRTKIKIPSLASISVFITFLMLFLQTAAWGGTFYATDPMGEARSGHTATLLPDGKVLVAGGYNSTHGYLAKAELFDPATGSWSSAANMTTARQNATATLLANGKVLVAGGYDGTNFLSTAELYDPDSDTWVVAGSMMHPRANHTATLLADGKKVLVVGAASSVFSATAEVYDVDADSWSSTANMSVGRTYHTATLLGNGKVLVAGGTNANGGSSLSSAELYDPVAKSWSSAGNMLSVRGKHTATLLDNGKVLMAGGWNGTTYILNAELYDPVLNTWAVARNMTTARGLHTATKFPDGTVLVAGSTFGTTGATAEIYTPATDTWTSTGSMSTGRFSHTATLLNNDLVLLTGGFFANYLAKADLYVPTGIVLPDTTITGKPSLVSNDKQPSFSFSSADGATFSCKVDSGDYVNCTSSYTIPSELSDGKHTFYVRATANGYFDMTPASYTWTVDTIAQFTVTTNTATNEPSITIGGTKEKGCRLMASVPAGVTSSFSDKTTDSSTTWSCTLGGYPPNQTTTISITGIDAIGNTTTQNVGISYDTTPPTAVIIDPPADPTIAGTYKLTVGGAQVAAYMWRFAGGKWSSEKSVATKISASTRKAGSYTVEVKGRDAAGNWQTDGSATSVTWNVDTTLPDTLPDLSNPPERDPATPPGYKLGKFYFLSDSPDVGLNDFECKVDKAAYVACSSPFSLPLDLQDGKHTVYVRAKDVAGNYDPKPLTYKWTQDTTGPALKATPVPPTNQSTVVISGTKTKGSHLTASGPGGVTFTFSGKTSDASTSWSCTVGGYPANQSTVISFTATDLLANPTTVNVTITYDTTPPTATITGEPASTIKAGTYKLTVGGDQVTSYKWRVNSGEWSTEKPVSSIISVSTLTAGPYIVEVIGRDAAGNWQAEGSSSHVDWTVDTTPPNTLIDPANPPERLSGSPEGYNLRKFYFISPDIDVDGFECKIDSAAYAVCVSPFILQDVKDGNRTLYVRAKDIAGNYDLTPLTYFWIEDTNVILNVNPTIATSQATTVITGTKETGSHLSALVPKGVTCSFSNTSTDAATSWSCTVSGYPANQETTIKIKATDAAGNATGRDVVISYIPTSNSWVPRESMSAEHAGFTATKLSNGKVLVAGGYNNGTATNVAELFDPLTGKWSSAGTMSAPRGNHAAALLPNGKVLVSGGWNNSIVENTAELYDPDTNSWSSSSDMGAIRMGHSATLLSNGKVLVVGGYVDLNTNVTGTTSLYDPTDNSWASASTMNAPHEGHTATVLANGKVLVVGGAASAELYDPDTNSWSDAGGVITVRKNHTATLLTNGKVLVAGGNNDLATVELYDPDLNTWSAEESMGAGRSNFTATLLPNGQVLVTGSTATTELYNPAAVSPAKKWSYAGTMNETRTSHTATLVNAGTVLVTGGYKEILDDNFLNPTLNVLKSAELYFP